MDHWERQQELQINFKVKIDRKPLPSPRQQRGDLTPTSGASSPAPLGGPGDADPIALLQTRGSASYEDLMVRRVSSGNLTLSASDDTTLFQSYSDMELPYNLEEITVVELKDLCRKRGLPAGGKKAVLLDRLRTVRVLDITTAC